MGGERRWLCTWGDIFQGPVRSNMGPDDTCGLIRDVLLVCKRMYVDVVGHLAELAVFNIIDLDTLRCLHHSTDISSSRVLSTSGFLVPVLPCIKVLDITVRLPLADFKEHEDLDPATSVPDVTPVGALKAGEESQLAAWLQLFPAITHLKSPRKLRIWLDHEDKSSWSAINERAVLSPLDLLASASDLEVSVNLSNLHPRLETPDRQFMVDSPAPAFKIHRRLRQRYHCQEASNGHLRVEQKIDFPFLLELCEFMDFYSSTVTSMAKIEKKERATWKRGVDVEKVAAEESSDFPCHG
ncbi:hypothetical protein BU16DRAFT_615187 [Lophium mytilinum]|uniref:Uncharacterized protein n=1 Tax=Lophium mytilinum TaxID=390894 RepID=A0A6A6R8Q2_9PEZI|nr:hypothetical protein BU16DRAFT_615187 [Lophium mytilinum]